MNGRFWAGAQSRNFIFKTVAEAAPRTARLDLNGDGKSDLLWRNTLTGAVHIQLLNGLAISSQRTVYTEPSAQWQLMGPVFYENQ